MAFLIVVIVLKNHWKHLSNDAFYSIAVAKGTRNLVKFYLVLITLFLSNHVVCLRRINTIKTIVISKIWHEHDYHYELQNIITFWLVWNNDLTTKHNYQMINSEVHDVWLLGTMSLKYAFWQYLRRFRIAQIFFEKNVPKVCILMIFEAIGTAEKKCNKDGKLCFVTVLKRFGTAHKSKQRMLMVHSDGI